MDRTPNPTWTRKVIGAQNPTRDTRQDLLLQCRPDMKVNCIIHIHCTVFCMSMQSLWWANREKCCLIKLLAANWHITSNQTENCEVLFRSASGPDFSLRTRYPTINFLCSFHLYWHFFLMSIEHDKTNRNLGNWNFSRSRLRSAVHNALFISFLKPPAGLGQARFFRLQSCLSTLFCHILYSNLHFITSCYQQSSTVPCLPNVFSIIDPKFAIICQI